MIAQVNLGGSFTLAGRHFCDSEADGHLHENLKAADLQLPPQTIADLDAIGGA